MGRGDFKVSATLWAKPLQPGRQWESAGDPPKITGWPVQGSCVMTRIANH